MEITAEIMQTYDLNEFAIAQSNGSTLLKIRVYEVSFINASEATGRVTE